MDAELSLLARECQFRLTFGGSHEDYLNEPSLNVQWMIAIKDASDSAQMSQARVKSVS